MTTNNIQFKPLDHFSTTAPAASHDEKRGGKKGRGLKKHLKKMVRTAEKQEKKHRKSAKKHYDAERKLQQENTALAVELAHMHGQLQVFNLLVSELYNKGAKPLNASNIMALEEVIIRD